MGEATLMLAVHTPLDDLRNREIKSNIADLLPVVQEKAAEYKATQYGITQEKLCREHRATLNKFVTSINDELREIGKANNAPFEVFSNEVKLITDVVKDAIASLDRQLTEMESVWRTNNIENAKILYDEIIGSGNTANWIPFEKILITKKTGRVSYEDFFGNKGSWSYKEGLEETKDVEELIAAGKKVVEELERFRDRAVEAWCAVQNVDYSEELINKGIDYLKGSYDPVKKGFDTEGAFNLMMTLNRQEREKQQAVGKNADRFMASIISAVNATPALQECTNKSILSSALLGQSLNLSPSPQLGQYYMVPFNDKNKGKVAQFQLGYKGYIQLAIRSGQYKKLNVLAIKEGELVRFDPLNEEIIVNLIADEEERENAKTIGYYAMFEYTNGFRKAMYWTRAKMEKHALKYSKGYAAKKGYTFWERDFDAMAYKTMLRQLISKWGIMSIDMQTAMETDMTVGNDDGSREYVEPVEEVINVPVVEETVEPAKKEHVAPPAEPEEDINSVLFG